MSDPHTFISTDIIIDSPYNNAVIVPTDKQAALSYDFKQFTDSYKNAILIYKTLTEKPEMLNEYFTNKERYGKFHRFLNNDNCDTIKFLYNNYADLTAADIEQY